MMHKIEFDDAEDAIDAIDEGRPVCVALLNKQCSWCIKMEKPLQGLIKKYHTVHFFRLNGNECSDAFGEVQGFPSYFLYNKGKEVTVIEGANVDDLVHAVDAISKAKEPKLIHAMKQGYVYIIRNEDYTKRYVGQTYQDPSTRWRQEASDSGGHNKKLQMLLRDPKTRREIVNKICRSTNKYQLKDCLDHFERLTIEDYNANDERTGGVNKTKGNRGASQREGYNYEYCVNQKYLTTTKTKTKSKDKSVCKAILKSGDRKGEECGRSRPCQYHDR